MSTTIASPIDSESKQHSPRSSKDDFKQQSALNKKQTTKDAPVDSGSSLVGGTIAAVQHAVDAGVHMLPASMQATAASVQAQGATLLGKAQELAAPVIDTYQKDGVIAAAKTATTQATVAASTLTTGLSGSAAGAATNLKASAANATTNLKASAANATTNMKASAANASTNIKASAAGAASSIKSSAAGLTTQATALKDRAAAMLPGAVAAGDAAMPKKHGRRRRGGRGHGNRKLKTRIIEAAPAESIADTLGEKAKELKEVVVEAAPSIHSSSSSAPGIVGSIRNTVGNVTTGISNTVSSSVSGVRNTATGLVNNATSTASGLVTGAKSAVMGAKSAALDRKPSLQRRDELPALGTPNTPSDSPTITHTADGKLAANPPDQSSLLDKAKFMIGGTVEAAKDFIADKMDNLSMNADDDKPMEGSDKSALDKAKTQLKDMKASVKKQ